MRRVSRRAAGIVGLLASAMLPSACAVEIPEPEPQPEQTQTLPVLDEARLERVLADLESTIEVADEKKSAELLTARVQDPALSVRKAEYALAKATSDTDVKYTPQPLTTEATLRIVAATEEWPRTVMVVTQPPEDGNVPLLLTLEQVNARSAYELHSWVRLLPGVETPTAAVPTIGSAQVGLEASGYLYPPKKALDAYATLLSGKDKKKIEKTFNDDPFRNLVAEHADSFDLGEAGDFSHATTAPGSDVLTLATEDGGYIVVGSMQTTYSFTKKEDEATIDLEGEIGALDSQDGVISDEGETLKAEYRLMTALHVPAKGDDAKVTVLGAERVLSKISHSDGE